MNVPYCRSTGWSREQTQLAKLWWWETFSGVFLIEFDSRWGHIWTLDETFFQLFYIQYRHFQNSMILLVDMNGLLFWIQISALLASTLKLVLLCLYCSVWSVDAPCTKQMTVRNILSLSFHFITVCCFICTNVIVILMKVLLSQRSRLTDHDFMTFKTNISYVTSFTY